eukprot:c14750_g1_i1.p1 GENE.c14750_g1_i1~~c14750_g1_i1.p1  ORF type:complete len:111 (+),score=26.30 c14750_g1_i1:1-333(+)
MGDYKQFNKTLKQKKMSEKKKKPGILTQKYDMTFLKKVNDIEVWAISELAKLYDVDEESLPVELDLHEIVELENDEERTEEIKDVLKGCPKDITSFIAEVLAKIRALPPH